MIELFVKLKENLLENRAAGLRFTDAELQRAEVKPNITKSQNSIYICYYAGV